jgi:diketogulonate reductase-like aldo/keto reductase
MTNAIPRLTLNNGVEMPVLGFGVYQVPAEQTEQAVSDALAAGYRSLDTAAAYRCASRASASRCSPARRSRSPASHSS